MSERVTFTDRSADRIARVVRTVEAGDLGAKPFAMQPRLQGQPVRFRICTFTGTWDIDTQRTVTFYNQTATPNTAVAYNLFAVVGGGNSSTKNPCAIAKDGTAWYLIAARCTSTCS